MSEPATLELREQFATPEQQRETASIGMWVFLITEVMLFGGLFTAFTVYRLSHPIAFDAGSAHMEFLIGGINTAVLICSSYTMALAIHSAETGREKRVMLFLLATMIIGAIFLALKFTEYYLHYQDHKVPA
ncbi:MAG: cytochrome c oxidase subunit 3, partial [Acidobacteriaceae bacterium]|nr:cytochrome c oxidase subunit 3 [Acidobacteriaceae bacterium]